MNLTNLERETIISYNEAEKEASVYTCSPALMRKLDKLCKTRPAEFKFEKMDEYSKWYIINKKCVRIIPTRILSEETKKIYSESAKRLHK